MVTIRRADGIRRVVGKSTLKGRERQRLRYAEQRAKRQAVIVTTEHLASARKGRRTKREAALATALADGLTPLEYMLHVLRDKGVETARRDWAAASAAPYLHAKLASTEVTDARERPELDDAGSLKLVRQVAFALALGARLQRQGHALPGEEDVVPSSTRVTSTRAVPSRAVNGRARARNSAGDAVPGSTRARSDVARARATQEGEGGEDAQRSVVGGVSPKFKKNRTKDHQFSKTPEPRAPRTTSPRSNLPPTG